MAAPQLYRYKWNVFEVGNGSTAAVFDGVYFNFLRVFCGRLAVVVANVV